MAPTAPPSKEGEFFEQLPAFLAAYSPASGHHHLGLLQRRALGILGANLHDCWTGDIEVIPDRQLHDLFHADVAF